ncbi:MAG TPA: 30S ribosomal protein S19 [Candidatus Saccharimonadales bacterium]|nr:30S ribosomal protein S19 [Candidatus Saccharimonadales bacterium]
MSRSLKKGPFVDQKLQKKVLKAKNEGSRTAIKTWARGSQITPEMVGLNMSIHNGKNFINVFVTEAMVGHRLGEFAPTRNFRSHGRVTDRTVTPT